MSDLISRADAIRIASGYCHSANIAKELAKLPSAQPEIIRCKECVHADEYYHCDYMTTWNNEDCFCCYAERKGER